ncbi:hypothetical protein MIND_01001600 [Mycena indigotica]|uniref:T-cell immunomodulatory protein TIP C2 domain-containing protein n=1 Tax=Mycena indigotica TaxID=2126181 RepID=A0A8H6VY95_9AGAR|nr:uncharacterized protein MIND_01001600 [Mycena indigotica]KAF7294648.1 hypothetical protein MIND_01001600 [Mycena indigotica]
MYRHLLGRRKTLSFLLLPYLAQSVLAIWPFPPKRFSGNTLVDAGSMGINVDGRIVAFGDFDGDQFLDALTLDSDQRTLTVHLWNHEEFSYQSTPPIKHSDKVYNVVPGDFTHSGKLDLLVMSRSSSQQLDLFVYPALPAGGFDASHPLTVPASSLSQPIPIDVDGDMKIDLLGMTPSSQGSSSPLQVWLNTWNASESQSSLFDIREPAFRGAQCKPANPHSNAVVDFDGDCLADLFLLCDDGRGGMTYQIWVNKKTEGFSLALQGAMPAGVQSVSFADIDRDGTMDMVFTTCSSVSSSTGVGSDCAINIAYNKQLPLCKGLGSSTGSCRPPEELCTADSTFTFDLSQRPDNEYFARILLQSLLPGSSLLVTDVTQTPSVPIPLKLGDTNLDGFPDLLFIAVSGQDHTPKMVISTPCGSGVVGCNRGHGWSVVKKGTEALDAIKDARGVAFLDIDEDGTLDILVQRTGAAGRGNIQFVQNNFYYDAFFLKAIVLNGACGNGWCYGHNASDKYHPYGVSYSGASYKYTVLDTKGGRHAAQVAQLPQTSYQSLQTPYSFFGLGRTNNYIENLFVGSTIHTQQHFINIEGVIPNSKLVILPPSKTGDAWKRELFLRPGEWTPYVTLTTAVGTLLLLSIIWLVLHLNEKREDELERRRASHHINFDAL